MLQALANGRYRLVRVLGQGGMATVYLAWDHALSAWRAIKVLDARTHLSPRARRRFENEGRAMARLRHPNVLAVHDVGMLDDRPFLVTELARGGSLAEVLERHGPLPPKVACGLVVAVLDGLQHAHEHGIVHRDVKPHNVLLDAGGRPLVADFGLARLEASDLTRTGAAMGTLAYMPPEQRSSAGAVDARADVYASAATLYALLTQREPLDLGVRRADWSGVPDALVPVLTRDCAYDPDERYPSARDLGLAIAAVERTLPDAPGFLLPTTNGEPAEPPPAADSATFDTGVLGEHAPRRRPVVVWLAAAGALAVVGGVALLATRPAAPTAWIARPIDALHTSVGTVEWTPDGDLLHAGDGRLWRIPLRGGEPSDLGPWPDVTFDVAPDGAVLMTNWYADVPLRQWTAGATVDLPHGGRQAQVAADGRVAWLEGTAIRVARLGDPVATDVGGVAMPMVYDLRWSADARWLAVTGRVTEVAIVLFPVDGGPSVSVVEDWRLLSPLRTTCSAWLPGGRLWYGRGEGPGVAVLEEVVIDDAGRPTGRREVTRWTGGPWPILASVSPEGGRVAVLTADRRRAAWVGDGAGATAAPRGRADAARWLPDGQLATLGPGGLVVGPADEPGEPVPGGEGPGAGLIVAGDLALLEAAAPVATARDLNAVPLAGGTPSRLLELPPNAVVACGGGRCMLGTPDVAALFHLQWLDPRTGATSAPVARVQASRDEPVSIALSPTADRLALFELGADVVLVDTADGATRRVPSGLQFVQSGAWAADGLALLAAGHDGEGWAIARVPLDGSAIGVEKVPGDAIGNVDMALDGRVVVVRGEYEEQIWVVEPAG